MRTLVGNQATDDVIRARWLALLPNRVQNVLKIVRIETTEQLLSSADQLMETPITPAVNAIGGNEMRRGAASDDAGLAVIKRLLVQLITITRNNSGQSSSSGASSRYSRSRSSSRGRTSRRRSQSPRHEEGYCFFHSRFRANARRCRPPYSFSPPPAGIQSRNV